MTTLQVALFISNVLSSVWHERESAWNEKIPGVIALALQSAAEAGTQTSVRKATIRSWGITWLSISRYLSFLWPMWEQGDMWESETTMGSCVYLVVYVCKWKHCWTDRQLISVNGIPIMQKKRWNFLWTINRSSAKMHMTKGWLKINSFLCGLCTLIALSSSCKKRKSTRNIDCSKFSQYVSN